MAEEEYDLQYCLSNRDFRRYINSQLPFTHFVKFSIILIPSLGCYFGYIKHINFIPSALKVISLWSLSTKAITIYININNLRKYLPSFSDYEEWKKMSILWLLKKILFPEGLVSALYMIGSFTLAIPFYYNYYYYYDYEDSVKGYLARVIFLRTYILLLMNTFKMLSIGSPISFRKYIPNESIIPSISAILLIIIIPIYILISLYYFFFGKKYTYFGKFFSLIFIISIAIETVISLHVMTAQINKKNAFQGERKSFIRSYMHYFHTKMKNSNEKEALKFANSLFHALVDKSVRNYIFGIGPYAVGSREEEEKSNKDLGIQELLTLQFRYTLFESLLKLPEAQKNFDLWQTNNKNHEDIMAEIFKEYKTKMENAKETKNHMNEEKELDGNENIQRNYADDIGDDKNRTNNTEKDEDIEDEIILSKKLWSALLGVHIEDYDFIVQ